MRSNVQESAYTSGVWNSNTKIQNWEKVEKKSSSSFWVVLKGSKQQIGAFPPPTDVECGSWA